MKKIIKETSEKCFALTGEFIKTEKIYDFYGLKVRTHTQLVLGCRHALDKETAISSFIEDNEKTNPGYTAVRKDVLIIEILPKNS